MLTKLQFEEVKDNLKYDLFELFDDYVEDIRITILNEDNIIIAINNDGAYNDIRLSKSYFKGLEYEAFKKILNELVFYAK